MKIEKDELRTFRLNRIFNIFNPYVYRYAIITAAISLTLFIIGIINKEEYVSFLFFPFIAVIIFLIAVEIYHRPLKISIYNGFVDFDDHIFLRLDGRNGFWWVKVRYSVSDICDMEFHQNFIEKMFDVGHIYFKGKATLISNIDNDKIEEKNVFTLYGIKDFGEFKHCFEKN